ncbi:hypothetical protein TCAL_14953 [Tigriopus californicus]|uniref:BTB domain-containing protein n=1 Tax=Tigriopus californicus TaxID=6832 RepID=A0A553N8N8_TIGCA|nr:uncharacterized protein LOC131885788 [Tigriopus californicus]XP_059089935.1 uncharacterized protein LOC131885788 [Tigriopus californicus]TRY61793.1 hypothetical protein TCAL_14953 [Tigriopus californicus]
MESLNPGPAIIASDPVIGSGMHSAALIRQSTVLSRLWSAGQEPLADLTLSTEHGDRVHAHSFLLRGISPWIYQFYAQIQCHCTQLPCPHESPRLVFVCVGFDLHAIQSLMGLIYTGQVEAHQPEDTDKVQNLCRVLGINLSLHRSLKEKREPGHDSDSREAAARYDHGDLVQHNEVMDEDLDASYREQDGEILALWEGDRIGVVSSGLHYCTFCDKRFKAKSMLGKHVRRHHKHLHRTNPNYAYSNDESEEDEEQEQVDSEAYNGPLSLASLDSIGAKYGFPGQQSWKCFKCSKLYTNFHKLKNHISSHFADEIIQTFPNSKKSCEFCKYKFSKKSDKVCHLAVRHDKLTLFVSQEDQPEIYTRKIKHREKIPTEKIKPLEDLSTAQDLVKRALSLSETRPNQSIACVVCQKETREGKPYRIHLNNHFMDTLLKMYPHYTGLTCNICKVTLAKKRALGFHLGFMHDGYKIISKMSLKDRLS